MNTKRTLMIVWLWGFVLTAYVCYGRLQYQSLHSQVSQNLTQTQPIAPSNKYAD